MFAKCLSCHDLNQSQWATNAITPQRDGWKSEPSTDVVVCGLKGSLNRIAVRSILRGRCRLGLLSPLRSSSLEQKETDVGREKPGELAEERVAGTS